MANVIKHGNNGVDTKAYEKMFSATDEFVSRKYGQRFGEAMANIGDNDKRDLVANITNIVFGADNRKAAGESGISSNASLKAVNRNKFLEGLIKEYEGRAELIASGKAEAFYGQVASQQWMVYGSHVLPTTQLALMALAPAVIKPIHNKVVKSVVTKDNVYYREAVAPYVMTESGETVDFYQLVNSKDMIDKYKSGGQKTISIDIPMADGKIQSPDKNGNICDIYNRLEAVRNPKTFKAINSIHDFVARGLKVTKIIIDKVNNNEPIPVDYISTGNAVQSGQLSDVVATIQLKVENPAEAGTAVEVLGNVRANGAILLTGSDKVKGITVEFFIPAKGAVNAMKVVDRSTTFQNTISRHAAFATTLNQQLIDDHKLKLNKDIVTLFSERSVELVNSEKDNFLINYLEGKVQEAAEKQAAAHKYFNTEVWQGFNDGFASELVEMTANDYGYTDVLHGHNIALSKGMFEVCNKIDVALNPQERNFTMYSSSSAAQWIRDSKGKDVNSLHVSGEVNELGETVGGLTTPYQIQNVKIGGLYNAQYIVTNKITSGEVARNIIGKDGEKKEGISRRHRYTLIPRFEENMDSVLFLHGLEYVTEGVNDNEYYKDKTLQYETRYDITTYNKALGVVDLVEDPRIKPVTKK